MARWNGPNKCLCAQVVSALSVFFILVSITIFCLKTHPNLRVPDIVNITTTVAGRNGSLDAAAGGGGPGWLLDQRTTDQYLPFFYIELPRLYWPPDPRNEPYLGRE